MDVPIPPCNYPILPSLSQAQSTKKPHGHSLLADNTKQSKMNAEQSLTKDNQVGVHAISSILGGTKKAGKGKTAIICAVLLTMSHN